MSTVRQSVLIMAGGTGGHIFPGLAVAKVFQDQGITVRWLGARGGMECTQVPAHGIELEELEISGVRGKGVAGWLKLPFRLAAAVLSARASLVRLEPDCVLSFGGYVAGPGGIAAWMHGIPLVVHEQNRVPGMTNKALSYLARTVLQAFPGTFGESRKVVTCGNPVRSSVAALSEPEQRFFLRRNRIKLLVTGGSQGARVLNELVPAALALLPAEKRPLVFHQAGRGNKEAVAAAYETAGINAEVHEFIEDMAAAYDWADLALCRAGALTVSELAAAGLGSVLVPYPYAVDDHQTRNAEFLSEAGAAVLVAESGLDAQGLLDRLQPLLADRAVMLEMAQRARSLAVNDAAEQVVEHCRGWMTR